MKTREQNEAEIAQHYGTHNPVANELIGQLIRECGLGALTDEAIARLAQLHREHEEQQITKAIKRKRMKYTVTIDFESDDEGAAAADSLFDYVAMLEAEFMVRANVIYEKTVDVLQREEEQS